MLFEIIIPITTVFVIGLIGYFTIRYNKKQHERTAMMDVFHMLVNSDHKYAEESIRDAYRENRLMNLHHIVDAYKEFAVIIERNYDQIGILMHEKLIPDKSYYITFGHSTVISYRILYDELKNIRIQGQPFFRMHFHNLAVDCLHYWYDKGLQDKHSIADPKTNMPISKDFFGEKIKP